MQRTFKLSRDPKFLEKLTDVVGVYLTPPQNAVVLCADEKSQIRALDRAQPSLPLKKGRCSTHDYKRHGTSRLFDALHVLEGKVIGEGYPRHRHQEFLKFLRRLDREFPEPLALHLIFDNYGTHGHAGVRRWLKRHPRIVLHFIPTSSSCLDLVERWFGELTQKAVRRGVFRSVEELQEAIAGFHDPLEHQSKARRVDCNCRKNPRETRPLSKTTRPKPPSKIPKKISAAICGTLH